MYITNYPFNIHHKLNGLCHIITLYLSLCVCVLSCSVVYNFLRLHLSPLSMEFSRQEYWSQLPFPPPGDLPDPGTEPMSPMSPGSAGRFFTAEPQLRAVPGWHRINICRTPTTTGQACGFKHKRHISDFVLRILHREQR